MNWNGEAYVREAERNVVQALTAIGFQGVSEVRESISTPGRTIGHRTTRTGRRVKVLGRYGSNPSQPGEPPHKQYGTLRRSIASEVDESVPVVRVGTPMAVGKFLEIGTRKMAPRPFLRPWLAKSEPMIREKIAQALARIG